MTCIDEGARAASLLKDNYTDGKVKVLYMFSRGTANKAKLDEMKNTSSNWAGFAPHGSAINDAERAGIKHFFPSTPDNGFKAQMLLKPGFEIVKIGLKTSEYKTEIDKLLTNK